MEPIQVVIGDDHELVRYGLRTLLTAQKDFRVIGEAANGKDAADICVEARPDVLVLDLRMPEMDGLEACRLVCERSPNTRVLILTSFDGDDDVFGSFQAGAAGYLMKDVAPRSLVEAIRQVAEGRMVLDEKISGRMLCGVNNPSQRSRPYGLSEREFEVLKLMAKGLNNRQIGEALWIGETTVKTHVSRVLRKLGTNQRTQAVLTAVREGVVSVRAA
ncbi:MAG: DNA-binding response regulator [Actinobacteria bacterium]|nr:MAG: DNA-binding response regulator [Actinomycetota bacterium]